MEYLEGETLAARLVANTSNTAVTWSASPAGVGSVTSAGLYSAPSIITAQQTVLVTATSVADPTKSASTTITLRAPYRRCSSIGSAPAALPTFHCSPHTVNYFALCRFVAGRRIQQSNFGRVTIRVMKLLRRDLGPTPFFRKRSWPSIQLSLTRDSLAHRGDKVSYPLAWTGAALL
jgi:hypothetical protein